MSLLLWIIGSTVLISLISLIGVLTLTLRKGFLIKITSILVAFAVGSLIGVSVFDLIPEAFEINSRAASIFLVVGILLFFGIERFVGWHHQHHKEDIDPKGFKDHHHEHGKPFVYLVLTADFIHNFVDGVLIAVSFLINIPLGIASTIAVALHEIPQEIGDFAILIHAGLKPKKALLYNFFAAMSAVLGGVLAFFLASSIENLTVYLLGIAGGGFLYLAMTDLLPEINHEKKWKNTLAQFVAMVLGLLIIYSLSVLMPA